MTSLWHNSTTAVISADRDSVDTARGEMIKLTLQSLFGTIEGRFHEPPFVAAIGDFKPLLRRRRSGAHERGNCCDRVLDDTGTG